MNRYLICLTIAPAFISASIYICLGRIVVIYGEDISRLRPRTYTIVFIICDVVSLLLQASGGAVTSIADADQADLAQAGINTMIAGLSSQVVSLAIFMALCLDFAWKVRKNQHKLNPEIDMIVLRNSIKWKAFLAGESFFIFTYARALVNHKSRPGPSNAYHFRSFCVSSCRAPGWIPQLIGKQRGCLHDPGGSYAHNRAFVFDDTSSWHMFQWSME